MTIPREGWVLSGAAVLLAALIFLPEQPRVGAYLPASPSEVLEKLSTPKADLRRPRDAEEAATLGEALIAQSRRNGGDPRQAGRAQAVLAPWWDQEDAPPRIRLLRATLKQSVHDFTGALVDLDALVKADPSSPQPWLTRATVLQVIGRYDDAAVSCMALERISTPLISATCQAQLDGLQGRAKPAAVTLARAIVLAQPGAPIEWSLSVLGDLHAWSADSEAALERYSQALKLDPTDDYTRGVAADLLLDLGRPDDAKALLEGHAESDALLLRYVLAARAGGDEAAEALGALAQRVSASRARGDVVHRREEARYALHLEKDAAGALALATANWAVQHEPADARILLEAALAAKKPAAGRVVLQWLERTGFEDPTLHALAKKAAR